MRSRYRDLLRVLERSASRVRIAELKAWWMQLDPTARSSSRPQRDRWRLLSVLLASVLPVRPVQRQVLEPASLLWFPPVPRLSSRLLAWALTLRDEKT